MIDNQKIKQTSQIERFKKKFYREHNIELYILSPATSENELTLDKYKELTKLALVEDHPKYKNYDFNTKSRERDFIQYIQVMSFLANKNGYSKCSIGKAIFKSHATVINSCKMVENGIDTKDRELCKVLESVQQKIDIYVGIVTENIERKNNTKPMSDPIWDEARRFINS
tara:strand:+ start:5157 stop:5666 length:510 start_codon:yes stop_codon:yes gene_type:complete